MIIVDSSVIFKWFNSNEAETDKAIEVLTDHIDRKALICVPDLIVYELANAWATKSNLSLKEIKDNLNEFFETKLKIIAISSDLINQSAAFSRKYHVTVYDAVYAILAKEKNCILITADEEFIKTTKLPFVKSLKDY